MLTIQRNNSEQRRKRAYSDAPVQEYRTLEEDYQDSVRSQNNLKEDELWERLSYTAPTENHYDVPERDEATGFVRERRKYDRYQSSSYARERRVEDLPLYTTDMPDTSMAIKKYNIAQPKKKNNVIGKLIIAGYIAVITLVATLVIVDSTMKTSAAATVPGETESQLEYIEQDTNQPSNWFDKVCDWFSEVSGD